MRISITLSFILLFTNKIELFSQNLPQGIAYQAVAIKDAPLSLGGQNATSFNWSNKEIQVRFSILDKYPGGSIQYSELHKTKTDEYGVFNIIIGQGTVISGLFDKIPWELGTAQLQVEIDFDNSNTFKTTSLERFWSVPYAFVSTSKTINNSKTDSAILALTNKFNYLKNRDKDTIVGNEGVSNKSLDSLNQLLKSQIAKVKIIAEKDTMIGNEWQNLTKKKDSILISNGTGIKLLDDDSLNELQTLKIKGDSIFISKTNGIKLPQNAILPTIRSYFHKSVTLSATLKSISSPYGWIWEVDSKVDTFNLQKGDRIVIYTSPSGYGNGIINQSNSIVGPTGVVSNIVTINNNSTSWGEELHYTAEYSGTIYLKIIRQIFVNPGTTGVTINVNPWYVEIN